MTCGIYLLKFKGTDKVYVGQSLHIEKRFLEHLSSFRRGTSSTKLTSAYKEFGVPELLILLETSEEELFISEEEAIEIYNSVEKGFNTMCRSGGRLTTLVGEEAGGSLYSNHQITEVFFHLIDETNLYSHKEIENITGVSISTIAQVSSSNTHLWLKDKYPEEYKILERLLPTRKELKQSRKTSASTTAKYVKEQYLDVLALAVQGLKAKDINKLTGVNIDVIRDITSCRRHKWLEVADPTTYQQLKLMKHKE